MSVLGAPSPPVFINPLDGVALAFRQRGLEDYLAHAQAMANTDEEFRERVLATPACRHLFDAGVYIDVVVDICTLFHAFAVLHEQLRAEFKTRKGKRKRGRPTDFFPMFQYCSDWLASQCIARRLFYGMSRCLCPTDDTRTVHSNDRRRFHEQFRDLAGLVYGRTVTVDSYCRSLKRGPSRWWTVPPRVNALLN